MDENGVTEFRKGVNYGTRLERARIVALLNNKQIDILLSDGTLHVETQLFDDLVAEIKETA